MNLKHAAFLASVLVLAACGGGKQEGDVRFTGFAPVTAKDKDVREVRTFCPNCGDAIEVDTVRHKKKTCNADIKWSESYRCPSCKGSGRCSACVIMEQESSKGECYNCKGQGVLFFAGQSPECPNCKGSKKCPVCKGSAKCDYCDGSGKVAKEVVKAKSAKFSGAASENEPPPSDPREPDKKKEEAPKEEPKKDDAPKEEPKKE